METKEQFYSRTYWPAVEYKKQGYVFVYQSKDEKLNQNIKGSKWTIEEALEYLDSLPSDIVDIPVKQYPFKPSEDPELIECEEIHIQDTEPNPSEISRVGGKENE